MIFLFKVTILYGANIVEEVKQNNEVEKKIMRKSIVKNLFGKKFVRL